LMCEALQQDILQLLRSYPWRQQWRTASASYKSCICVAVSERKGHIFMISYKV
jgi:hypothetical protein